MTFNSIRIPELSTPQHRAYIPLAETTELDAVVREHIEKVLELTSGKIHGQGGAAELLGMNGSTLRSRMKKLGIEFKKHQVRNLADRTNKPTPERMLE